jgi:asparagine synthase (glutamine-hydrolysing)
MDSLLNQLLHCNLRTKGAHHILTKVERLTAASGLQGRSPLFDRAVIDHAFTVPPRSSSPAPARSGCSRRPYATCCRPPIVDRPKSGMRLPVQRWLSARCGR